VRRFVPLFAPLLAAAVALVACRREAGTPSEAAVTPSPAAATATKKATFGAGCFWCVEAIFERVEGVLSVESGYAGGTVKDPTYEQVCGGDTGHAEAVQITFDPAKVSYDTLLEIFWKTHDPTTPNRQGADVGTQYRSVVFVHDAEQRKAAEALKAEIDAAKIYDAPIVTQIVPYDGFWKAEDYHQGYYDANRGKPYCRMVIAPKVEKLEKLFHDRLKSSRPDSRDPARAR
jgi:peptide-methionine (S)-S-oxide reductase